MISLLLVVDRHKLTVFYLKSFDMDSVQVRKAVFLQIHNHSSCITIILLHTRKIKFKKAIIATSIMCLILDPGLFS